MSFELKLTGEQNQEISGRQRVTRRRLALLALTAYLTTYALLSSQGQFILANHGGAHWTNRWGPAHLVEPYQGMIRSKERLTPLGLLYYPCIVLDRLIWHRSDPTFRG